MEKPIRQDGGWLIRWTDEDGTEKSEIWHCTEDEAQLALDTRLLEAEQIRRGIRVRPPKDRPFEALCQKWLATRTAMKRTGKDDQSIIKAHLMPAFGQLTLRQITSQRIAEFSADLMVGKKPQTIRNILTLLGAMLNEAVCWGWIKTAPRIRKPKKRACEPEFKWLRTKEEIDRLLSVAAGHKWSVTHPIYMTAIYTGMRAGELAGLQWGDVDLEPERRLITVQRSYSGPTKNGRIRHVPIADVLYPELKKWKLASGSKRLVFPNNRGQMWDQSGRIFQEVLREVLQRGGFPRRYITFHSLRHTFASHWVMRGGDLFKLQNILGHSEPQMTLRYAHLKPDAYESDWGIFGGSKEEKNGELIELRQRGTL